MGLFKVDETVHLHGTTHPTWTVHGIFEDNRDNADGGVTYLIVAKNGALRRYAKESELVAGQFTDPLTSAERAQVIADCEAALNYVLPHLNEDKRSRVAKA